MIRQSVWPKVDNHNDEKRGAETFSRIQKVNDKVEG
jgi:hypothetical protein